MHDLPRRNLLRIRVSHHRGRNPKSEDRNSQSETNPKSRFKFETRMSKSEANPKFQFRNSKRTHALISEFCGFEFSPFEHSNLFRISDFGFSFRENPTPPPAGQDHTEQAIRRSSNPAIGGVAELPITGRVPRRCSAHNSAARPPSRSLFGLRLVACSCRSYRTGPRLPRS